MGRLLETLKLGDGRRPAAQTKKPDDAPVQDCVVDWEIGEEVPFVEVGGPNKKVELSPGLMKHPAESLPKPPHVAIEIPPKSKVVNFTQAQPMTVAFEPWPGATVPQISISPEVITYHHPDHAASKEYANLLDAMLAGMNSGAAHVLLLVGLKPHVGTSTVLLNLGVLAAQAKKLRVALVDANLARPCLAKRLGCATTVGLAEVMDGTAALEHSLVKTEIGMLHLLPADNKQTTLTTEAMSWIVAWLRERYDLVLIDGPTLDDAAMHVPHAHGVYLILGHGESVGKGLSQTLCRMGGRLCGLIHTHFEM
jgi:Mrp family chromosome partitioning ATPase